MKPFNLEAALAGAPVVTRDGHSVEIIGCSKSPSVTLPLVVHMVGNSFATSIGKNGRFATGNESGSDLFMAPIKTKYYVGVYKTPSGAMTSTCPREERDYAQHHQNVPFKHVTTLEFEVEE